MEKRERKHPREALASTTAEITREKGNVVFATVLNISRGGAAVMSDIPLGLRERIAMVLSLRGVTLQMKGAVVWCHFQEREKRYAIGVQTDAIKKIAAERGSRQSDSKLAPDLEARLRNL